jgi:NADH:ubiquinone oxidoreductase subunit K
MLTKIAVPVMLVLMILKLIGYSNITWGIVFSPVILVLAVIITLSSVVGLGLFYAVYKEKNK